MSCVTGGAGRLRGWRGLDTAQACVRCCRCVDGSGLRGFSL